MSHTVLRNIPVFAIGTVFVLLGVPCGAFAEEHLDADRIAAASGAKATTTPDGVVRIAWARNDVPVKVDGMPLKPFAGLGSWAAFTRAPHGAMVMGDTVVFEDEVTPAMDAAFAAGLEVTGLHNHFFFDEPKVYFMHIGGMGEPEKLAASVKDVWDAIKKVRSEQKTPTRSFAGNVPNGGTLDAAAIERVIGQKSQTQDGVVKVTIGRQGSMHGVKVAGSMGLTTWAAFSGGSELAAVDGDFIMTGPEVQAVLRSLRKSGMNIVALHNHMVGEEPAFYFTHFWGKGPADELAKGIRSALDAQAAAAQPAGPLRPQPENICKSTGGTMRPSHRMGIAAATVAAMMSLLAAASVRAADEPPLEREKTIALKGPVGGLDHLAIDSARGRLFVANTSNNTLDVVDVKAGTLLKQVPDQGRARGVAYSPEADRVFVGCGTGGVCSVLDGKTYDVLKAIPLGTDADNVRYNPRTRRIYVVHADTELSVIDAEDYTLRSPIALPKSLGAFQIEAGRPRMYINAKAEGVVVALDSENDRIISRCNVAPAGVPAAVAIDEPNRRLFVGCRREPSLVVMDSDTGKVVGRVPIPGDVDDVSFDAKRRRIYASCGDGAIAVIRQVDADRYEPLATVTTVKGARTSVFDPEGGRLYVAVPRRPERPGQETPEVWVYRANPGASRHGEETTR